MISIVGFNEKEKAVSGYWKKVPGHVENVLRGQTYGPHGPQGGYWNPEWVEYEWVDFSSIVGEPAGPLPWILGLVVIVLVFVVSVVIVKDYLESGAYKSKVTSQSLQNGATSTWDGDEFQYNLDGYSSAHIEMILTIDSIKNGSFYGKVHWPYQQYVHDTLTKAEGTIVANVNHKDIQWKYVNTCNRGKYLEFTETQFIQGNSVVLHVKYYAVVCDGTLSGVWFYPDKPNDAPGGEFSLQWKSP